MCTWTWTNRWQYLLIILQNSQYSQEPKPAASVNFSHWCKFNRRFISHENMACLEAIEQFCMNISWAVSVNGGFALGDWIYSLLDQSMFKMEATLWALTTLTLYEILYKSSFDGWMGLMFNIIILNARKCSRPLALACQLEYHWASQQTLACKHLCFSKHSLMAIRNYFMFWRIGG